MSTLGVGVLFVATYLIGIGFAKNGRNKMHRITNDLRGLGLGVEVL